MTRISENSLLFRVMDDVAANREQVAKYSEEVSSGVKVAEPGDSVVAGTISQLNSVMERVETFSTRISSVRSYVMYQNDAITQAADLMLRAKEIAVQGANETNSPDERKSLAEEVFQLRDHLVSLANSRYMGSYVFGGLVDNAEPYTAQAYTNGAGGSLSRYEYSTAAGSDLVKSVRVTENLTLEVNIPGNTVFDNSIQALERLGRSLQGYATEPAAGAPDGLGNAYTLPADFSVQTTDIQRAIDLIDGAVSNDLRPKITDLAGRLKRLDTADSLLELTSISTKEVLGSLRDADVFDSASNLANAQNALQAAMQVNARVLQLSIMDFL